MKVGSFNAGNNGEHKAVVFVEISKISVMQDTFFFEKDAFTKYVTNLDIITILTPLCLTRQVTSHGYVACSL